MSNQTFGLPIQGPARRRLLVARGRGNQSDWSPSKTYSKPPTSEHQEWNKLVEARKEKKRELKKKRNQ